MVYTHVAAAILGGAIAGYAGWTARDWQADAQLAELRSGAEETRRLRERANEATRERVDRADAQRAQDLERAAAGDRARIDRLRRALAARDAQPAQAACAPVERQFAECRSLLDAGAGVVGEGLQVGGSVDRQARGLREWAEGLTK